MKVEFPEEFDELFCDAVRILKKCLRLKIDAIKHCEENFNVGNARSSNQTNLLQTLKGIKPKKRDSG
jgi:hypothetical protein